MLKWVVFFACAAVVAAVGSAAAVRSEMLTRAAERLEKLRSIALTAAVFLALFVLIPMALYQEHRRDRIVLTPIQVPEKLAASLTSETATQLFAGQFQEIQRAVRNNDDIKDIAREIVQDGRLPDIELPGLEFSLRSAVRYLSTSIGWDGPQAGAGFLDDGRMVVWLGDSARVVGGGDPQATVRAAALELAGQISPCFLASYLHDRDEARAQESAVRCLARASNDDEKTSAYLLWAKTLERYGHPLGAAELYRFAESQGLTSSVLYLNWGTLLYSQKEFAAAREKFERAASAEGHRRYAATIAMNRGLTYHEESDDERAIKTYREALALASEGAEISLIQTNLGNALRTRALGKKPDSAEAKSLRVEALASHMQAVAANPLGAYAHNGVGCALLEEGNAAEARREFEVATTFDPNFAEGYHNAGRAYFAERKLKESVDRFATATTTDEHFAPAYTDCAQALVDLGEVRHGIAAYSAAIELKPDRPDAYIGRGRARAMRCDFGRAIDDFAAALRLSPGSPYAKNDLAATLIDRWETNFDDRDLVHAQALLEEVVVQYPDFSFAHAELGRVQQLRGNADAATREYELALGGGHPRQAQLRTRLESMQDSPRFGVPRVAGPCRPPEEKPPQTAAQACKLKKRA